MLQVRVHGPDDVRVDDIVEPHCGPRDALVEVACCGICGTDIGYATVGGVIGVTGEPLALGHEISGRVTVVGEAVEDIPVGLRVAVNPMAGHNLIGNGGPEGGFAELLRIRGARLGDTLHALPDALDDETGALVEPLAVGMHAANIADVRPGESAVVIGAGAIGLAVLTALLAHGVEDVVVVDLSRERLVRAERLGACAVVDSSREDFFGALAALHGTSRVFGQPVLGSRVFFDAAGAPEAIRDVVRYAGFGARLVVAGVHKCEVPLDLRAVLAREIRIQGAIGYPSEFPAAIDLLLSRRIDVASMVSHRFALEEFSQALAVASDRHQAGKVMIAVRR